ncbi:MAG: carbohydrate binding family 9 domain-containing protein, partial [Gemmatimonadetes bacterium]|nr:carbohydrate binding family 9 domain-containing protein [Gemmatimonadota bacterium]
MLPPLALLVALAQDSSLAYDGGARALAVRLPRYDSAITVDGVLDEAVWSHAARLVGFSQYQPVDSRAAEEPTEVLVWYGATAIYFGIRAREAHGDVVRATHADRDNIGADDYVQILLDTYHDRRRAFLFGVNPFGVQQDGIRSDEFNRAGGEFQGGGGFGGNINILEGNVDLNPDFVFESRGRLVPVGYEVEVRIPFKSLRYQGGDAQTWGINVLRRVQHSGYQDSWAPVVRASASFLGQSGTLEGLHDLRRGLVLELTPFATSRVNGAPDSSGYSYADTNQLGLNVRWGLTQNLSLDGTWNPDFSQVEADVGQVTLNERFALFFPEKRPFFLEGLELFATPNTLIYTRRIVSPDAGVKLAGKVGATNVAVLLAADDTSQSATGSHPFFAVTRLRRDLGRNSTLGLVGTAHEDGDDYSRLAGADVRLVHSRLYFVELQAVRSWTRAGAAGRAGSLFEASWDRTGRGWGFNYG